jgi:hypothetical protein
MNAGAPLESLTPIRYAWNIIKPKEITSAYGGLAERLVTRLRRLFHPG